MSVALVLLSTVTTVCSVRFYEVSEIGYPEFIDRHLGFFHTGSIRRVVKNGDEGTQVVTSDTMVTISYR
jgi:hypothetical protein